MTLKTKRLRHEVVEDCYRCRYSWNYAQGRGRDGKEDKLFIETYCLNTKMRGPKKVKEPYEAPPNWCPLERWPN